MACAINQNHVKRSVVNPGKVWPVGKKINM